MAHTEGQKARRLIEDQLISHRANHGSARQPKQRGNLGLDPTRNAIPPRFCKPKSNQVQPLLFSLSPWARRVTYEHRNFTPPHLTSLASIYSTPDRTLRLSTPSEIPPFTTSAAPSRRPRLSAHHGARLRRCQPEHAPQLLGLRQC